MARLILMFNNQVVKEYPLKKESITIGRNEGNVITVDNLAVSGYHARIDVAGKEYILTDLQSTNGTFVNDKKIVSHKLVHGDNIIVGKHRILFVGDGQVLKVATPESKIDMDKTMMLDTAKQKELLAKQAGVPVSAAEPQKIGMVSFIGHAEIGEIELNKKLTKIGKAETSEIKLAGFFMPATAATISKRPSGYVITSMEGKLKVNGRIIKESTQLNEFDNVELGKYKFQFYYKGGDK
ncbi:MAG: FHA domain-containing protein [Deltaproteobacteria bacterium]|nr:FHA domain-containing protein [Deltaproteobacteria bacterium]